MLPTASQRPRTTRVRSYSIECGLPERVRLPSRPAITRTRTDTVGYGVFRREDAQRPPGGEWKNPEKEARREQTKQKREFFFLCRERFCCSFFFCSVSSFSLFFLSSLFFKGRTFSAVHAPKRAPSTNQSRREAHSDGPPAFSHRR